MLRCSTMFMSSDCNIVLARGNYRYKHSLSLFVNTGSQIWLSFIWQLNGLCTPTKNSLCTLRCRTELNKYKLARNSKAFQTLQRAIYVLRAVLVYIVCLPKCRKAKLGDTYTLIQGFFGPTDYFAYVFQRFE